jgi:hypothetical protein
VQLQTEQVLRIRADFIHGRVLVANIQLVVLRHDGRKFEVLGDVAGVLVMVQKMLMVSPPSSAFAGSEQVRVQVRGE